MLEAPMVYGEFLFDFLGFFSVWKNVGLGFGLQKSQSTFWWYSEIDL